MLGALGSACWEWAFKPLAVLIYDRIILQSLHLFNDSFYSKIATSIDSPMLDTYCYLMMFILIFLLFPPSFLQNFFHRRPEGKADATFLTICKFTFYIIIAFDMMSTIIAHQIAEDTLINIEILAPCVSDAEYKTLKSDFYRIDSKDDYLTLANQIESLLSENNLDE